MPAGRRYVTFSVRLTPTCVQKPSRESGMSAVVVQVSNSVAAAPPWRLFRELPSSGVTVRWKIVLEPELRVPCGGAEADIKVRWDFRRGDS
jgi:hypothetical protein